MHFAIFFEDDDAHADQRALHMDRHLDFLETNAAKIGVAGPLTDTESGRSCGGLWIVQADGVEAARALVEADPFWPTGLRKSVRILEWSRVFADGRRLIRAGT